MKKLIIITALVCLTTFACEQPENTDSGKEGKEIEVTVSNQADSDAGLLLKRTYRIGDSLVHTDLRNFKYFGTFFKGRASYFHNHTDTLFHGAEIKGRDLLICFLDDQIARLKYHLDSDISTDLMKKYGSFKIKPLDSISRVQIKTGKVIVPGKQGVALHENLKSYELTWDHPDKQIVFKRSQNFDLQNSYIYEERIPDYRTSMMYLNRF